MLVSNKISSYRKKHKYFIGYLHHEYKIKPLHITFPETSAYVNWIVQIGYVFPLKMMTYI